MPEHDIDIYEQLDTEGTITLGPTPNEFDGETARDTQGTDDPDWLEAYDEDPTFLIQVEDTNGEFIYQRRWEDDWEDVTRMLRGPKGEEGSPYPVASESDAESGTSAEKKTWTPALIRRAIEALSPILPWAKSGDTTEIPADKIPSIPEDKLPDIPDSKLPAIPSRSVVESGDSDEIGSWTPQRIKEAATYNSIFPENTFTITRSIVFINQNRTTTDNDSDTAVVDVQDTNVPIFYIQPNDEDITFDYLEELRLGMSILINTTVAAVPQEEYGLYKITAIPERIENDPQFASGDSFKIETQHQYTPPGVSLAFTEWHITFSQLNLISKEDAEAGRKKVPALWSPLRIKQAIRITRTQYLILRR